MTQMVSECKADSVKFLPWETVACYWREINMHKIPLSKSIKGQFVNKVKRASDTNVPGNMQPCHNGEWYAAQLLESAPSASNELSWKLFLARLLALVHILCFSNGMLIVFCSGHDKMNACVCEHIFVCVYVCMFPCICWECVCQNSPCIVFFLSNQSSIKQPQYIIKKQMNEHHYARQ